MPFDAMIETLIIPVWWVIRAIVLVATAILCLTIGIPVATYMLIDMLIDEVVPATAKRVLCGSAWIVLQLVWQPVRYAGATVENGLLGWLRRVEAKQAAEKAAAEADTQERLMERINEEPYSPVKRPTSLPTEKPYHDRPYVRPGFETNPPRFDGYSSTVDEWRFMRLPREVAPSPFPSREPRTYSRKWIPRCGPYIDYPSFERPEYLEKRRQRLAAEQRGYLGQPR